MFTVSHTLRQELAHPKEDAFASAIQCQKEIQELIHRKAQHRRATSSGQASAIHLHSKETRQFQGQPSLCADQRRLLVGADRGVKQAFHVKLKKPRIFWFSCFAYYTAYNTVLQSLHRLQTTFCHSSACDPADKVTRSSLA